MIYVKAFLEEIRIGLETAWNYRMSFVSEIVTILILYLCLLFWNSGTSLALSYPGGNAGSKELLLAGYMLWNFSIMAINTMSDTISAEATSGTLEHKYMSIIPMSILNLAIFVRSFIIECIIVGIILIVAKFMFNISIAFNILSICIIIITSIGMYGIGMILGGIALKEKRIGKVIFILQILFLFMSDTITNVSNNIQISKILPLTLGNDLLRESISFGSVTLSKLYFLILISLLWIVIGTFIYKVFERKSKKEGLLGTY